MTEPQKFRKKPVVIEAMQYVEGSQSAFQFCPALGYDAVGSLAILTPEGSMSVNDGDWIIRGVKGEFYPCKPDVFEATYEAVPNG